MSLEPKDTQYISYPQADGRFVGYWTKDDPSRIPELASPNGQNTTPNQGDRITIRNFGFDIYPNGATLSEVTDPSQSLWTFHLRTGEQILLASQGANLVWFDETSQTYANLGNAYQSSDFGFAEFNINSEQESRLYFGNAIDNFSYWTGAHTNLDGALVGSEAEITVDSVLTDIVYDSRTATTVTNVALVTNTSTATSSTTLTLAAAGWVINDYATKYVYITSGPFRGLSSLIASNTADTLTFAAIAGLTGTPSFIIRTGQTMTVQSTGGATWGTNVWSNFYLRITSGAQAGKIALIASNTGTILTTDVIPGLSGTPTFEIRQINFSLTNKVLRIGTSNVTYDRFGSDSSFLGVTGAPAASDGAPVAQAVVIDADAPKGNIYLAADNRLFIAGIHTAPQAIYFSKYTDASDWADSIVTDSTADAAGVFNLVEGGGAVTAMVQNEQTLYFFKENIIYAATLSDSLYSLVPLKPFDGRSQTTGAKSKRAVFVGGNRVFFVSKDNQIYSLQRVETVDYPQMVAISQPIQPTIDVFDFSTMSGIVFNSNAYFTCKSAPGNLSNDVILVYNTLNNTWDTPVVNLNASDFCVYSVSGTERLMFGDAIASNVFIITTTPVDYVYNTKASWRTKQYDFGSPCEVKQIWGLYVEGYINDHTELTITLYLDENGFTSTFSTIFSGTETTYLFNGTIVNTFGKYPFGIQRFGSNADTSGKVKFRVYLNEQLANLEFYNLQLEFSSDGSNQAWEIIRYGFQVRKGTQPIDTDLIRSW